jgi:hypothetical protein
VSYVCVYSKVKGVTVVCVRVCACGVRERCAGGEREGLSSADSGMARGQQGRRACVLPLPPSLQPPTACRVFSCRGLPIARAPHQLSRAVSLSLFSPRPFFLLSILPFVLTCKNAPLHASLSAHPIHFSPPTHSSTHRPTKKKTGLIAFRPLCDRGWPRARRVSGGRRAHRVSCGSGAACRTR